MATKVFSTVRFDVFHTHIERAEHLGMGRDVYLAFSHQDDIPRSLCEITLYGNYVEWIHVDEDWRRNGVGREVMIGLTKHVGQLNYEGATEAGEAFCNAMDLVLEAI